MRKLGAEGPDGFLREEAFAARELARAAVATPLVQCECVRVHAGAGWPLNRPLAAGWANRPSQYLRGAFALVERIGISNQYEGRQSWTDDGMHEMSVRLDDGTDSREASQCPRYIWTLSVPTIRPDDLLEVKLGDKFVSIGIDGKYIFVG